MVSHRKLSHYHWTFLMTWEGTGKVPQVTGSRDVQPSRGATPFCGSKHGGDAISPESLWLRFRERPMLEGGVAGTPPQMEKTATRFDFPFLALISVFY